MTGPRLNIGPRGYRWNPTAKRYIDPSGKFVSRAQVRRALDAALRTNAATVRTLSQQLTSGALSLDDWWAAMRTAVKDANLYGAAAARGGWAQMTQADYGRVGAAVRRQYAYLDRFVGEIDGGLVLDGRFLNRAMSYMNSGRTLYEDIAADVDEERGMTEERNVLGAAEHCGGCLAETARGVVPIGELVPIGSRICRGNCRCKIQRRRGPGSRWE